MQLPDNLPERNGIHRVPLTDGRLAIFKRRRDMPADFLTAEMRGLEALRVAKALRVPAILAHDDHALLLEDLGQGAPAPDYPQRAAQGLAAQHAHHDDCFGFAHPGWCGGSPQDNKPEVDGYRFFAERRLLPQAHRARDAGLLSPGDTAKIESLCATLPQRVPGQPAVLLHGDLWTGNLHCCAGGQPALIDAGAVHYGWAEAELAMLTLFGAPPVAFFDAYAEVAPLAPDWRQRAPLYNLYHLLNHLNLFGAGYLSAVREVLTQQD